MNILTPLVVGIFSCAIIVLPLELTRLRYKYEEKQRQLEILSELESEITDITNNSEILGILVVVYSHLRRSRASCRPWIHDCIVEMKEGRGCDPRDALAALIKTGDYLAGTRWDTDEMAETFGQAAEKLAAMI